MFIPRGNVTDIQVLVGNSRLTPGHPSQIQDVQTFRAHEAYTTEGRRNDLAILKVGL
jgi:hypothetical protein